MGDSNPLLYNSLGNQIRSAIALPHFHESSVFLASQIVRSIQNFPSKLAQIPRIPPPLRFPKAPPSICVNSFHRFPIKSNPNQSSCTING